MRDMRESAFSSVPEQIERATCPHVWAVFAEPTRIFGYLVVEAQCATCRTYRGTGAHDATMERRDER